MEFLGWYTTGGPPDQSDILVHKQVCEIIESPLFLKLNPMTKHTDVSTSLLPPCLPASLPPCLPPSLAQCVTTRCQQSIVELKSKRTMLVFITGMADRLPLVLLRA
ncbi:UNVERIFIED_CONTAM: hypothetical protein FKN15_065650 [Acipenser sinensis]